MYRNTTWSISSITEMAFRMHIRLPVLTPLLLQPLLHLSLARLRSPARRHGQGSWPASARRRRRIVPRSRDESIPAHRTSAATAAPPSSALPPTLPNSLRRIEVILGVAYKHSIIGFASLKMTGSRVSRRNADTDPLSEEEIQAADAADEEAMQAIVARARARAAEAALRGAAANATIDNNGVVSDSLAIETGLAHMRQEASVPGGPAGGPAGRGRTPHNFRDKVVLGNRPPPGFSTTAAPPS
ncbi:hypothetical protein F4777DRAFT_596936 [Nemania sp. FL0916]|nr:hypothetical protein F4777DRAFT_596936 [Nemania sp. FL0916]